MKLKHVMAKCLPTLLKILASHMKWIITVLVSFCLCCQDLCSKKTAKGFIMAPVTLHPTASETCTVDFSYRFIYNLILNNPKPIKATEEKFPLYYHIEHVMFLK